MILTVTNSNSFKNPGKVKVLHYVQCAGTISVLHMEEKMIWTDRYKDTSKHRGYVDAAQRQRKLNNFGASSATANLN